MSKKLVLNTSSSEIEGVPSKINLLPLGLVKSQKGDFIVDQESFESMKNHFEERGLDLVIDYEHQTLENVQAPAGGWIKELILEENSISANVEWTPKATEYLKNKEYRYLSPVVIVRESDSKALILHSAALTNTPAIDNMFAVINSIDLSKYKINQERGNKKMDLEQLIKMLGLEEGTTEEEVIKALEKLQEESKKNEDGEKNKAPQNPQQPTKEDGVLVANSIICGALGINTDSKTEDIVTSIMALKNPSNFVTESQYKALKEKIEKKDSEELVMKAFKDGKISASQKEWAKEYALKDSKGFESFMEKAPKVVPVGEVEFDNTQKVNNDVLFSNDTSMKACKMLGLDKETIEKYLK